MYKKSNSTCQSWHGITAGVCNQCVTLYVVFCRVDYIPQKADCIHALRDYMQAQALDLLIFALYFMYKNPTRLVRVGMASPQVYVINALHCILFFTLSYFYKKITSRLRGDFVFN